MNTKLSLIIVNTIVILICVGQLNASIIDQQQPGPRNYGFWFEQDVSRWQEFSPMFPVLDAIELNITRWGDPGDILVDICNSTGMSLYLFTVSEADIPRHEAYQCGNDWIWIDLPDMTLSENTPYRIKVSASKESTSVNDRYFWNGVTGSDYTQGISCVENSWPNYDFCFKTYAVPEPTTISLLALGGVFGLMKR